MTTWEYLEVWADTGLQFFSENGQQKSLERKEAKEIQRSPTVLLNRYGEESWELINYNQIDGDQQNTFKYVALFKRKIAA